MAGTYNGSFHGGNEFTGETSFSQVFALNDKRGGKYGGYQPPSPPSPPKAKPKSASSGGKSSGGSGLGIGTPNLTVRSQNNLLPNAPVGPRGGWGPGTGNLGTGPRVVTVGPGGPQVAPWSGDPVFAPKDHIGDFGPGQGEGQFTEIWIGGIKMPRDPKTSDGQEIEDAYGESEFLTPSWFMQWAGAAANTWYGYTQAWEGVRQAPASPFNKLVTHGHL